MSEHTNCDGGLLPASNIKDYIICLKCGWTNKKHGEGK